MLKGLNVSASKMNFVIMFICSYVSFSKIIRFRLFICLFIYSFNIVGGWRN